MRRLSHADNPTTTADMLVMQAVFVSGLLLAMIVLLLVPGMSWLALPLGLLPLLPAWLAPLFARRPEKVFAPDPVAPAFDAFASRLAEDLAAAPLLRTPTTWRLCPAWNGQGEPAPYAIDFDSKKGRLVIEAYGRKTIRKTGDLVFRPAAPLALPVTIAAAPVVLRIAPGPRRNEVSLSAPSLPARHTTPFGLATRLWLAALLACHIAFGATPESLPRVLLLALLPFILRPLLARLAKRGQRD